ncbi:CPCC family cysteine-rich protein [Nonomuraea insulae]|uniref:CPCC family cysteine-rich protein n=1 Tax=Nonomuraea insulae TaxID=1616787 RepID=A0ABW1D0A1_9ACTN
MMPAIRPARSDYPCPCCGHLTFGAPPGSHEICSVCFWEDDAIQLRWPDWPGGANKPSLIEAQRIFQEIGACEERLLQHVRPATTDEPLDPGWRPIDLTRDSFEPRDQEDWAPWPIGLTVLYWWRSTFWHATTTREGGGPDGTP